MPVSPSAFAFILSFHTLAYHFKTCCRTYETNHRSCPDRAFHDVKHRDKDKREHPHGRQNSVLISARMFRHIFRLSPLSLIIHLISQHKP